jgi:L-aspartate oxidase
MPNLINPGQVESLPEFHCDAVVMGAGVAGLSFVLHLPDDWSVVLLTKGALGESNTRYAQGGLSAALGADDSPLLHEEDTLSAGARLCDPDAVRTLVEAAPTAVDWLLSLGTSFDRNSTSGEILLGREAAHSRRRVLHAGGDATGAEIERSLVERVRQRPGVQILDHSFAVDLLLEHSRCVGIIVEPDPGAELIRLYAPTVVIAAGGAGQLWSVTSNPPGATADGLAMALRANVAVADLEFVQFHPTVLAVPGTEPFLVTEAVRGEGAYLRNRSGERFMETLHPLAELAPRDVVARGIQSTMTAEGTDHVYLDLRHLDASEMYQRFPTITRVARERGFDLARDLIPVAPAAHYFIGGIAAGTDGATSLPGLVALGEASCTGVHGANRLASNSLLEGLVFGRNAALAATARGSQRTSSMKPIPLRRSAANDGTDHADGIERSVSDLQAVMGRHVAVVREAEGLSTARDIVERTRADLANEVNAGRAFWQAMNQATVAIAVIEATLARQESRGAHYRADFPDRDPDFDFRHSILPEPATGTWQFGSLAEARAAGNTSQR